MRRRAQAHGKGEATGRMTDANVCIGLSVHVELGHRVFISIASCLWRSVFALCFAGEGKLAPTRDMTPP